jgi:hypothetical protein
MTHLLIDFNAVVIPNGLDILMGKIKKVPSTDKVLGLVLLISEDALKGLVNHSPGIPRINHLNSGDFVSSIRGWAFLVVDQVKGMCEIVDLQGPPETAIGVVESAMSGFPNNFLLVTRVPLGERKSLKSLADAGFRNPCLGDGHLTLSRPNALVDGNAMPDIEYTLSQLPEGKCGVVARLSKDAVRHLKQFCSIGSTLNKNGTISQKEMAGRLVVRNVTPDLVHVMDIDHKSMLSGDEEGVSVAPGLYNFHSHPKEAYVRNEVKFGWPSCQDYIGFVAAHIQNGTIFHLVTSLEGVYIISISKDSVGDASKWGDKLEKFIEDNFDIRSRNDATIAWYIGKVNAMRFPSSEGGRDVQFFSVTHFPWESARTKFGAAFAKQGGNCFANEDTLDRCKVRRTKPTV